MFLGVNILIFPDFFHFNLGSILKIYLWYILERGKGGRMRGRETDVGEELQWVASRTPPAGDLVWWAGQRSIH